MVLRQLFTSGFTIISQVFAECWLVGPLQWQVVPFPLSFPSLPQNSSYVTAHSNNGFSDLRKHCYRFTHGSFHTVHYRVTQKTQPIKFLIKSYKDPVNFQHVAGFKLQSVYNHSPKFQPLKPLRIKVMFFPKYAPNGLHGVGGKRAYVVQNFQLLSQNHSHIVTGFFHDHLRKFLLYLNFIRIQMKVFFKEPASKTLEIPSIRMRRLSEFLGLRPTESHTASVFLCVL